MYICHESHDYIITARPRSQGEAFFRVDVFYVYPTLPINTEGRFVNNAVPVPVPALRTQSEPRLLLGRAAAGVCPSLLFLPCHSQVVSENEGKKMLPAPASATALV